MSLNFNSYAGVNKWSENPVYTITYDLNAGIGELPIDENNYLEGSSTIVFDSVGITREGYVFICWNTDSAGNGATYISDSNIVIGAADIVLYAKWTNNPTYTITYDANGGSGIVEDQNKYIEAQNADILDGVSLQKEGYSFNYWSENSDGSISQYDPNTSISMPARNLYLYAQWEIDSYAVNYLGNGNGLNLKIPDSVSTDYVEYNSVYTLDDSINLDRKGYVLTGWNTETEGTGQPYVLGGQITVPSSDLDLYAQWETDGYDFISKWVLSPPDDLTAGMLLYNARDLWVDWGDGVVEYYSHSSESTPLDIGHTYSASTEIAIIKLMGNYGEISSYYPLFTTLYSIENWGAIKLRDREFYGIFSMANAPNLTYITSEGSPSFSEIENLSALFAGRESLEADLSNWNISNNIKDISGMFAYCSSSVNITGYSTLNLSFIEDMSVFFRGVEWNEIWEDIGTWSFSSVRYMQQMFYGCRYFNSDISDWTVSTVQDMSEMFYDCESFNTNISSWDVHNVMNMSGMFSEAVDFNQPIGAWNVGNVTNMSYMFKIATSFNQNIGNWNVENVTSMEGMFMGVTLSTENYDAILIGWELQNVRDNVKFHGGGSQYSAGAAADARQRLIDDHGWIITDGGQAQ